MNELVIPRRSNLKRMTRKEKLNYHKQELKRRINSRGGMDIINDN